MKHFINNRAQHFFINPIIELSTDSSNSMGSIDVCEKANNSVDPSTATF